MLRSGLSCVLALGTSLAPAAVTMEMVTVGDTNNPADPLTGYGSVPYAYQIGKYEVRNSEYVEFLNSVAATDTYGLYNGTMATGLRGGITQSGSPGSYTYAVKDNMGDKPVVYISYYDAVRFANWLENGQPVGPQGAGTTETGSYTLFTDGGGTTNVSARGVGVSWVIPNENEWYKGAYYDPTAGATDYFWLYPTQSDGVPTMGSVDATGNITNDGPNVVNYSFGADWNGQDGNVTTVGSAGTSSDSYYGTFDQGGNAGERIETFVIGGYRGVRGGTLALGEDRLRSSDRLGVHPANEYDSVGFRIAFIPETSNLAAVLIAALGLCEWKRRLLRCHPR